MFQELLTVAIKNYCESQGLPVPGREYTLADTEANGRVDVAVSHRLKAEASKNPITAAIFDVARPYVDGILVQQLGPARIGKLVGDKPRKRGTAKRKKTPKLLQAGGSK